MTVSLQVTDSNGVVSTDQTVITILAPVITAGPVSIGQGPGGANTLLINGTSGDDVIRVVPHGDKGDVSVIINGVSQGVYTKSSFSAIAIYGQAGNDRLQVDDDVKCTVYLFGGAGNDVLIGGGGPSYLDGGAGDDKLFAGEQSSVLIGSLGADVLSAGDRGALLIAGSTDFDNPAALLALWNSPKTYADRAATAKSLLAGHIFDDGKKDVLNGGDGLDLYFYSLGDVLHDKTKGELAILS